jgi:flagellar motor component MotA
MFLSRASVAAVLGGVTTLAVLSALTLAPPDRLGRRLVVALLGCLVGIWTVADLVLALIRYLTENRDGCSGIGATRASENAVNQKFAE